MLDLEYALEDYMIDDYDSDYDDDNYYEYDDIMEAYYDGVINGINYYDYDYASESDNGKKGNIFRRLAAMIKKAFNTVKTKVMEFISRVRRKLFGGRELNDNYRYQEKIQNKSAIAYVKAAQDYAKHIGKGLQKLKGARNPKVLFERWGKLQESFESSQVKLKRLYHDAYNGGRNIYSKEKADKLLKDLEKLKDETQKVVNTAENVLMESSKEYDSWISNRKSDDPYSIAPKGGAVGKQVGQKVASFAGDCIKCLDKAMGLVRAGIKVPKEKKEK